MDVFVLMILFFVVVMPLVLGMTIPTFRAHSSATGDVVNYDPGMRKFIYKIPLSKAEIIALLSVTQEIDELSCTFDFERSVIRFSEYGSHRDYYFQIQEHRGFSVLKLEQVAAFGMQSHVPYKLNPFMVGRLQAEMMDFSQNSF